MGAFFVFTISKIIFGKKVAKDSWITEALTQSDLINVL